MNKSTQIIVFTLLLLGVLCASLSFDERKNTAFPMKKLEMTLTPPIGTSDKSNSVCDVCVQLMSQTINQLINIILNVGVLGTCQKLWYVYLEDEFNV